MKIVITGTSRGIGLELTHQALQAGHDVLAVARNPEKSKGLLQLRNDFKNRLTLMTADLEKEGAAADVAVMAQDGGVVDVLINNAGIMKTGTSRADFMESFLINSVVPFEVTEALWPLLKKSKAPKVIQMTSLMGSISDNSSGGYYAYRASKTALNMINMSLVKDHPGLCSVVMHPGWVQTDMGGPEAPTSVTESASGIWKVIHNLKPSDSGRFFNFKGQELKW